MNQELSKVHVDEKGRLTTFSERKWWIYNLLRYRDGGYYLGFNEKFIDKYIGW